MEPAVIPAEEVNSRSVLSGFDAATIVAGSMIGSGIFIVSADIARHVGSPAVLLMVWLVSGLMTIAGALAYGELAVMMPQAGGQYVYLREAYGRLWGFLFGWTLFLVIQTGTIAAVAVAFARFAGVLFPALNSGVATGGGWHVGFSRERVEAIAVIAGLTAVNLRGLNTGRLVQNLFTTIKILALVLIALLALAIAPNPAALRINFGGASAFMGTSVWSLGALAAFGAAMVGGLFSADAWASVTFVASETRRPERDLPFALASGTLVVIALYVLVNVGYLAQLPLHPTGGVGVFADGIARAQSDRVAAAAMQMVWPRAGAALTAALVMISTFGCANGLILTGAWVLYAMARDGVFWRPVGLLNSANVPSVALVVQGVWACLLTLTGSYGDLLDYVIFAQLLFYVLTVGAVFWLRVKRPDAPRPYKAWGYPIVPAAYIVAATALMIDLLIVKPRFTWPGLLIVLAGIPVFMIQERRSRTTASTA
ncbi:MAG TPA: amino acid permease [Candidatus Binataceae bacterium]|nr:amino acid permease [Candidatus Binataceae bacterium]